MEKRILGSLLDSFSQKMIVMADGSLKHPLDSYPESFFMEDDDRLEPDRVLQVQRDNLVQQALRRSSRGRAGPPTRSVEDGSGPDHTRKVRQGRSRLQARRREGPRAPRRRSSARILSNDGFSAGYPESLRVAHHLSVFSRSEDMALKAYLTNRHSLKQMHVVRAAPHHAGRTEQLRVRVDENPQEGRSQHPGSRIPQRGRPAGGLPTGH